MNEINAISALYAIKKDLSDEIDYKKNILFNTCVAINTSETKGYIDGLNFAMNSLKRNWNGVYGSLEQGPVFDKIRSYIEESAKINQNLNPDRARTLCWCLNVIDQCRAEMEGRIND